MKRGVSLEVTRAAKQRAAQVFAAILGEEVSVGITRLDDDGFGLKVNLTAEPDSSVSLPDEVQGVSVQMEVVGPIKKRVDEAAKKKTNL